MFLSSFLDLTFLHLLKREERLERERETIFHAVCPIFTDVPWSPTFISQYCQGYPIYCRRVRYTEDV